MSYGEGLSRLNPLGRETIAQIMTGYLPPEAAVADVGCGRGDTLGWLREHTAYRTVGVEADPDYAASCGALVGRAEELPLADRSLDGALMECVFSLLDQAQRAADELSRVLRDGGVLLLSDLYGRQGSTQLPDSALLRHIYSREQLEDFFIKAGFQCQEFRDHTFDMQTMLGQMILDGVACDCCAPENRALLKQAGAGYGLWVFRRQERRQ